VPSRGFEPLATRLGIRYGARSCYGS
jgi:hypothetical protein